MDTGLRLLVPALFGALAMVVIALTPCAARAGSDEEGPEVPEPVEVCISCHAIAADEPVLEGPTLWGVVGRPVASVAGFEYSEALRAKGGTWTTRAARPLDRRARVRHARHEDDARAFLEYCNRMGMLGWFIK